MADISLRVSELMSSPTRKFVPLAEKAKKEGAEVIHLNIGQPDIPTPKPYFETLKKFSGVNGNGVDEYVKSQGLEKLRKNFIDYLKLTVENTDDLTIDNCMITMGGTEGLDKIAFALFNPGDKIIIPEPFYTNYNSFFAIHNVEIVPYTTDIRENFSLGADFVSRIRKMVESDKKIRGILITNPGNPTGGVYTKEELEGLAGIVKEHDLWLISEEIYREFVYDGEEPRSVLSMDSIKNNVVVTDSISKKWSACGARVGFVVSYNGKFMKNLLKLLQTRLSASRVNQEAASAMIESDINILEKRKKGKGSEKTYAEKARDEYEKRRKVAYDILKANGIVCGYPKGALYLIADLGEIEGLPIDAEDFCRFVLEEFRYKNKTVMVTFAGPFYKTPGLGKSQVRLAFVHNPEKTKEATDIFCRGVEAYKNK